MCIPHHLTVAFVTVCFILLLLQVSCDSLGFINISGFFEAESVCRQITGRYHEFIYNIYDVFIIGLFRSNITNISLNWYTYREIFILLDYSFGFFSHA